MREINYKFYKKIREESKLPVKDKCASCNKKFEEESIMYPVEDGENFKFICEDCKAGKRGNDKDTSGTVHKTNTPKEGNAAKRFSKKDE